MSSYTYVEVPERRKYMKPLIKGLDHVLRWALIALATFMILVVTWQVISRYVLRAPSSLTEEIARFGLIWLGLLGSVYTFRNRMHVGIDILVSLRRYGRKNGLCLFDYSDQRYFDAGLCLLFHAGHYPPRQNPSSQRTGRRA